MSWPAQVLIVAQDSGDSEDLQNIFRKTGVHTFCYSTLLEAKSFSPGQPVSAIFVETPLPDGNFQAMRADVERFQKGVPIVALVRNLDWHTYLSAMGAGAFDCLAFPASTLEAKRILWSALQVFSTAVRQEAVAA